MGKCCPFLLSIHLIMIENDSPTGIPTVKFFCKCQIEPLQMMTFWHIVTHTDQWRTLTTDTELLAPLSTWCIICQSLLTTFTLTNSGYLHSFLTESSPELVSLHEYSAFMKKWITRTNKLDYMTFDLWTWNNLAEYDSVSCAWTRPLPPSPRSHLEVR